MFVWVFCSKGCLQFAKYQILQIAALDILFTLVDHPSYLLNDAS
jgi:hypothetical protein